jgi:hypothetical protein
MFDNLTNPGGLVDLSVNLYKYFISHINGDHALNLDAG